MAASFALFALLITLFVKVYPILAVWEIAEEHENEVALSAAREHIEPAGTGIEPAGGRI